MVPTIIEYMVLNRGAQLLDHKIGCQDAARILPMVKSLENAGFTQPFASKKVAYIAKRLFGSPESDSITVIIFRSRGRRRVIGSLIFFACASRGRGRRTTVVRNDSSLAGFHMLRAKAHRFTEGRGQRDREV